MGAAGGRLPVGRGQGDVVAAGLLDPAGLLQTPQVGPVADGGGSTVEVADDEGVAVGEPGLLGTVEAREEAGHRPYGRVRGRHRAAVDPGLDPGGERGRPQRGAPSGRCTAVQPVVASMTKTTASASRVRRAAGRGSAPGAVGWAKPGRFTETSVGDRFRPWRAG